MASSSRPERNCAKGFNQGLSKAIKIVFKYHAKHLLQKQLLNMIKSNISKTSLFAMIYIQLLKQTNLELTNRVMTELKRITYKKIIQRTTKLQTDGDESKIRKFNQYIKAVDILLSSECPNLQSIMASLQPLFSYGNGLVKEQIKLSRLLGSFSKFCIRVDETQDTQRVVLQMDGIQNFMNFSDNDIVEKIPKEMNKKSKKEKNQSRPAIEVVDDEWLDSLSMQNRIKNCQGENGIQLREFQDDLFYFDESIDELDRMLAQCEQYQV